MTCCHVSHVSRWTVSEPWYSCSAYSGYQLCWWRSPATCLLPGRLSSELTCLVSHNISVCSSKDEVMLYHSSNNIMPASRPSSCPVYAAVSADIHESDCHAALHPVPMSWPTHLLTLKKTFCDILILIDSAKRFCDILIYGLCKERFCCKFVI